MTMCDYLSKMKNTADSLATIGHPVMEEDHILYFLVGLGSKYDLVVMNITFHLEHLSL